MRAAVLLLLLSGCATTPFPPAVANTRAEAECKVMYDQAMISIRGYAAAQDAKTLYWDCVRAKSL